VSEIGLGKLNYISNTVQCSAVQCSTVQCSAVRCSEVSFNMVLWSGRYYAMRCTVSWYYGIRSYGLVECGQMKRTHCAMLLGDKGAEGSEGEDRGREEGVKRERRRREDRGKVERSYLKGRRRVEEEKREGKRG
jgi:hypothetical protein